MNFSIQYEDWFCKCHQNTGPNTAFPLRPPHPPTKVFSASKCCCLGSATPRNYSIVYRDGCHTTLAISYYPVRASWCSRNMNLKWAFRILLIVVQPYVIRALIIVCRLLSAGFSNYTYKRSKSGKTASDDTEAYFNVCPKCQIGSSI